MTRLFAIFVLRELLAQRVRTLTTMAGIALGIAVVLAIQLAAASALRGFESAVDTMAGRAALEITQPALGIDEARLPGLIWLQRVGQVTPIIEGEAAWTAADGSVDVLHVLGIDILTDLAFRDYAFADAGARRTETTRDLLAMLTDPQAVVLTQSFARRRGLRVGDRIRLAIGEGTRDFRVRGLLAATGPARAVDGNVIVMDIAAAQLALDRLGYVDRLEVRLPAGADIDRVEADLARALGADFSVQRPERRGRQVERMLAAFHANLTALSAIALIVGVFLVYNTVSTSVLARRHEIGMLRAVGAGRATVFGLFIAEAVMLAIPGCLAGLALGRLLADGAVALTSGTAARLASTATTAPPELGAVHVALAFAVGVPLAIVAAFAPALEASRVPPTVAIRESADMPSDRRAARLLIGAVAVATAWGLSTLGPIAGLPIAGYLAALCIVVATAAFTAPVVQLSAALATRLSQAGGGIEARLASATLVEYARRLSVSIAALAVSLAMTVAIAVMVASFRETVTYWIGQTLVADLFVGPASRRPGAFEKTIPPGVEQLIRAHPGVAAVDTFRTLTVPYGDSRIIIGGGDFAVLLSHGRLMFKSPARPEAALRGAIGHDVVVVSEAFALRYRTRVGASVSLPTRAGNRAFRVAAIYYDYSNDRGTVVLDRQVFARYFDDRRPGGLSVYLKPGADPDRVRNQLTRALAPGLGIAVRTNAALRTVVLRIFDRTFAITWALELVAIAVAVMGIVATLVTLIVERRGELSLLRLVGADRRQVRRMVVIEAALVGGISQVLGLVAGLALSLVLVYVINVQSFGWSIRFHVPVMLLIELSVILIAATALAGLYPARRAAAAFLTEAAHDA